MPSDDRMAAVLDAVAAQRDAFRATIGEAVDEVRRYLVGASIADDDRVARLEAELGAFGAARIDPSRFAVLFPERNTLDAVQVEVVEEAFNTLSGLARRDVERFVATIALGGSLRAGVARALADVGRAFGAARVVEAIKAGRYRLAEHAAGLAAFPFERWNRAERRLAPPLVVDVEGRDLRAAELTEFLDGAVKIVVVVRGACAPAPLVRLITPRTFVMQTTAIDDLSRLFTWDGPGIVALVPDGAAQFMHDPGAGVDLGRRLTVAHLPTAEPRKALGLVSATQQTEELHQLRELAKRPAAAALSHGAENGPGAPVATADPADKLAAWLLREADLTGVE